jgi:uncharacterized membrane protein YbhN (UPF0104 family)
MNRICREPRFGLGMGSSLIFLWLVMRQVTWSGVIVALQAADWRLLPPGLLFMMATWGVFAIRWRVLFNPVAPIRWSGTLMYQTS